MYGQMTLLSAKILSLFSSLHMSHYFGVIIIIIALAMYYNLIVGPESPSS